MSQTAIADRIKQILDESGMTTSEFSNKLGVQRSGLSHVFNGRNRPGLDLILRLVKVFPHVSYEWLLDGKASKEQFSPEGRESSQTDQSEVEVDTIVTDNRSSQADTTTESFHKSEDTDTNVTKEEPAAPYRTSPSRDKSTDSKTVENSGRDRIPIKIIVLYSDGRFESFHS